MNVLISGSPGFLGSCLVKRISSHGHKVIALTRAGSNNYRLLDSTGECEFYCVENKNFNKIFMKYDIDIVINTVVDYGRGELKLESVIESNLIYGLMLLEASIKAGVAAYINTDTLLIREIDAYSLSKAQLVDWMRFIPKKNTKVINVKIEHFFGILDDDTKFIYWLMSQLKKNVNVVNLTSGVQKRDFIYIDDVVDAYICIINNIEVLPSYEEFELGSGNSVSIKYIINKIYTKISQRRKVDTKLNFGAVPYRKNEQMDMSANISKIQRLGWKVNISLDIGMDKVINHIFKDN